MKEDRPPEPRSTEERVRALGFDPRHLTPLERIELLHLHLAYPDERVAPMTATAQAS